MRVVVALSLLAAVLLAGCNGSAPIPVDAVVPCGAIDPDFEPDERYAPTVTLETSRGDVELVVFLQQVPLNAGSFLVNVDAGYFDGTHFHQLAPNQFIVGGDPFTASNNRDLWGTGGYEELLVDEFHQFLRHDGPGMVSIVSRAPNQGGTQFMVAFTPRPDRDDLQTVFARVLSGLPVLKETATTPTDERGRPQFDAEITRATVSPPQRDASEAPVQLSSFGYDCEQTVGPGGRAEFLLAVRNSGQRVMSGAFDAEAPEGWTARLRDPLPLDIASGQTAAYVLDVEPPDDAEVGSTHTITVTFSDDVSDAATTLDLEVMVDEPPGAPEIGDVVRVHYAGVLDDGRPFDTTELPYIEVPWFNWFREGGEPPSAEALAPLSIEVGTGREVNAGFSVVPGFQALVDRAQFGQTVVAAIPPAEAYGEDSFGDSRLGGRTLYFQVQIERP